MANPEVLNLPQPIKKRRRWGRALAWFAVGVVVLVVVAYFVCTSSAFFEGIILPKVSKALGAKVTVTEASISPFSQVVLRNLKIETAGKDPLLECPEARANYHLLDILKGNIRVDDLSLSSPVLALVENPDGTSNLDPIKKTLAEQPKTAPSPGAPSKPPKLDIKKVALTDATVRRVKQFKPTGQQTAELAHLNLSVETVRNGQPGKLALSGNVKWANNPPTPGTNGLLEGKFSGELGFALTPDLKPESIHGATRFEVTLADGALADLTALNADLDCEVTPTEIKQLALHFLKGKSRLGEVRIQGPMDLQQTEGRLKVQVVSIDKQVLNIFGAASGLDFGPTMLNSTNDVLVTGGGSILAVAGQTGLSKFQVTRAGQTTPPLEAVADYNLRLSTADNTLQLNKLNCNGVQRGNVLFRAELTSPMTIPLGNTTNAASESSLTLSLNHLDLADWRPFLGNLAASGNVDSTLRISSTLDAKKLTFNLDCHSENLDATISTNRFTQAGVIVAARGQVSNLSKIELASYSLDLAQQQRPILSVSGSGVCDLAATNTAKVDAEIVAKVTLANLARALPQLGLKLSSGIAELHGRATYANDSQAFRGSATISDLTGIAGPEDFHSFGCGLDCDLSATPKEIRIATLKAKLQEGANDGGGLDLSGTYDLKQKTGQFTANISDINQCGLRPFLEHLLAEKRLASAVIAGTASGSYDGQGQSSVQANLQLAHLVVSDIKNPAPSPPLDAKLQIEASLRNQIADIKRCSLGLTPTNGAQNEIRLNGRVDFSDTKAITGNLNLAADSLDLTSYYDLFAVEKPATSPTSTTSSTATSQTGAAAPTEPAAISLPLRNFTNSISIGRLSLRELQVTNFQAGTYIDGSHVVLSPLRLGMNGAPVSAKADADLGVRGYKYAVDLNAAQVPFAPLVDSFAPERKGQLGGSLSAIASLHGQGVTWNGLEKNLTGQFDIGATNLNFQVINIRSAVLKRLISVVAVVPDLFHNPESAIPNFLGAVTGLGKGGLAEDLARAPINTISVRGVVGSERLELQQARVESAVFRADAAGQVGFAAQWTNSTLQVPISLALSRAVGDRIGLGSSGPATNSPYVPLPQFLTMRGTLGDPKEDINKLVLAGSALKGVASVIPHAAGKTGAIIQDIGGLLTGQRPGETNAAGTTNATNAAPLNDLLNLLKPKKQ